MQALELWEQEHHKGIISVVTGGGKTVFALSCIDRLRPPSTLIVVPTVALLDQWWEEVAHFFDLPLDSIHVISGRKSMRTGTVNLAVLNTASKLESEGRALPCFLVVDECHKAASEQFRAALDVPKLAALGLSATPERPYDEGLTEVLIPKLGRVIFEYTYRDAKRDSVIVPFRLFNVVFDLEPERIEEYERLTKAIARSARMRGADAEETVALYLKRARVVNLSLNRIRLTAKLVAAHRRERTLIFHEDIDACELINTILKEVGVRSAVYHSRMRLRDRAAMLAAYREGALEVLVTCRALDEGFNVPETQIGIIAASTATRRQRIQRLGRILRPASGKDGARIYTLVATGPEIARLKDEESELEGVADVSWSRM